jgi:AcrR family transcriptional regulator
MEVCAMSSRPRRADATANQDRIVAAARAALSESNGSIDDLKLHLVAKAAGVGQGTLYRHFPTREHLLADVYRTEIGQQRGHDPLEALTHWLDRLLDYVRVKRGVMAAIEASAWHELYADQHERLDSAFEKLLSAGRASGDIRPDVDATDVFVLLGALSRIPAQEWDERSRTVVAVIADGLRTR